jgi:hypothetical protein
LASIQIFSHKTVRETVRAKIHIQELLLLYKNDAFPNEIINISTRTRFMGNGSLYGVGNGIGIFSLKSWRCQIAVSRARKLLSTNCISRFAKSNPTTSKVQKTQFKLSQLGYMYTTLQIFT